MGEDEDGRGGWCSCNVVIYQPRNEGLMVVICIRVQEGTGMGFEPVKGGGGGLCLGGMRIDRLVDARSN